MIIIEGLKNGPVEGEMCILTLYGEGGAIQHFEDKAVIIGKWKALEPHGELIERDKILEYIENHEELNIGTLYDVIQDAPTILEASE